MSEWDVVGEKPLAAAAAPGKVGFGDVAKQAGKDIYKAVTGLVDAPKELVERSKMSGHAATRDVTESMIPSAMESAAQFSPSPVASKVGKLVSAAPTQEALFKAANEGYESLKKSDVRLPSGGLAKLYSEIEKELIDNAHRDYNAPITFKSIKELLEPVGGRPGQATVGDVEGVRQLLNNIEPGTKDSVAAGVAKREIDKYLDNVPDIAKLLKDTRGNYAAASRSKVITSQEDKAERGAQVTGSGANIVNKLRQKINQIIDNPEMRRGMSEDELQIMRDVAKGGKLENILRLVSKLGPNHPISGWMTAIGADLSGGGGLGTMTLGTGAVAHEASKRMTQKKIDKLDETIRARSPLGGNVTPDKVAASVKSFVESSPVLMSVLRSLAVPTNTARGEPKDYLRTKGM